MYVTEDSAQWWAISSLLLKSLRFDHMGEQSKNIKSGALEINMKKIIWGNAVESKYDG